MSLSESDRKRIAQMTAHRSSGCRDWTGKLNDQGVPVLSRRSKTTGVRSELLDLEGLPEGVRPVVIATCGRRRCVARDHLGLVGFRVRNEDGSRTLYRFTGEAKGRAEYGDE